MSQRNVRQWKRAVSLSARRPGMVEDLEQRTLLNGQYPTIRQISQWGGPVEAVEVVGTTGYLTQGAGLAVVDLSDPAHPRGRGRVPLPGFACDVRVAGDYAYVADDANGLQIVSIANPDSPTLIGSYDTSGYAAGVSVVGSYAYVADGSSLQIVNVSDVDEIAPTLTAVAINNGNVQRSMVRRVTVSFAEPVSLSSGALAIKLSSGTTISATLDIASSDQQSYLLTFSGTGISGGSLADGIYDLIVSAAGVQDLAGNALAGDYTQRFHRLFGDVDGNRVVNALDYAKLKATYGRSSADPLYNRALDYENNDVINALDLAQFRKRYGMSFSY